MMRCTFLFFLPYPNFFLKITGPSNNFEFLKLPLPTLYFVLLSVKAIGFSYCRRTLRGTSTEVVVATRGARTGFLAHTTRRRSGSTVDTCSYICLRRPFGRISHTFYATVDSRDIHTSFHSSDAFRFLFCSPLVQVLVYSLQKGFASEMVSQHLRSLWTLLVDVISNNFQEVIAECDPLLRLAGRA